MENALKDIRVLTLAIQKHGCVLLLDFDGTLSPLVTNPADAALPAATREILRNAAKHFPIAIISGRPLAHIRRLIGIRDIAYAGEHGRTWGIGSRHFEIPLPRKTQKGYDEARSALIQVAHEYPALVRENKKTSIAFNYRTLSAADSRTFRSKARRAVAPFIRSGSIRLLDATRTFEVAANTGWTKGECALHLYKALKGAGSSKRIPVYIGDSLTDEDAYRALSGGITIRVGNSHKSAARYYLRHQRDVASFIKKIIATHSSD
ncbi:trehalose-phosphatase [Candidatus Kaiserbacteria bacterium]|nr:trehalose-phosphatase [Candidatus Kaiserbacteria bacterium]